MASGHDNTLSADNATYPAVISDSELPLLEKLDFNVKKSLFTWRII